MGWLLRYVTGAASKLAAQCAELALEVGDAIFRRRGSHARSKLHAACLVGRNILAAPDVDSDMTQITTQITPHRNNLLIRRAPAETRAAGGLLIIPDSAQGKAGRGTVVAAGPGRHTETGTLIPPQCRSGDVVLFRADLGHEVVVGSETLVMLNDDAVMVVIEEGA